MKKIKNQKSYQQSYIFTDSMPKTNYFGRLCKYCNAKKIVSVILSVIIISALMLNVFSEESSVNDARHIPTIDEVYSGEISYDEYISLGGSPTDELNIQAGTYYLNNAYYGKYLRNTSGSPAANSDLLSSLGTSIQWNVTANGSNCTIQSVSDTTKYLAVNTSGNGVSFVTADASTIGRCLWSITVASGGGCIIQSVYNSKYLFSYGNSVYVSDSLGSVGTVSYKTCTWRAAKTSYYGNTSSYTKRELSSSFSISDMVLDVGESGTPTVNKSPTNALWASASDFTYSTLNTAIASANNQIGKINAVSSGNTTVVATHKPTGLTKSFSIEVFSGTYSMYICSSTDTTTGHAWLVFKSNSCHNIYVGQYNLESNKYVTIGKYGISPGNGFDNFNGMWYNREVYSAKVLGYFQSGSALVTEISAADVQTINSVISEEYAGYNLITDNCVTFAIDIWNTVSPSSMHINSYAIPSDLKDEIEGFDNYISMPSLNSISGTLFGFYDGQSFLMEDYSNYI